MQSPSPGERPTPPKVFRPFTGELASPALEATFRAWSRADYAARTRTGLRVGAVLMSAFCLADVGYLGWGLASGAFCAVRLAWSLLALHWGSPETALPAPAVDKRLTFLVFSAAAVVLAATAVRPPGFQPHTLSAAAVMMGVYLLLPLRFGAALGAGMGLTLVYLGLAARGGALPPTPFAAMCAGFLVANGVGITGHNWISRMARSEFLRVRAADEAHAERLAFLAATSHELRTPLHGIVACAELLSGTALSVEQRELVGLIRSSSAGMAGLLDEAVRQVRGGAELPAIDPTVIDLHAFLDEIAAFVRARAATRGIVVELLRSGGVPRRVQADGARLRQVLLNLAENALAHGARAKIALQADAGPPLDDGRVPVEVGVVDDGPGVPREMREAILRPFVQAGPPDRNRRGMGLGLAICDRIARAMDGRVEIDDAPGGGARFRLRVPLACATEATVDEAGVAPPGGAALTLLLVEDEVVSRRLMTLLLERDGHRVTVATSGEEAIELVGLRRYDAVLLDLRLPRIDGVETARRILAGEGAEAGAPPLVAMSAHVAMADHDQLHRAGFRAVLSKPVELGRLRATLTQLPASSRAVSDPGRTSGIEQVSETLLDEAELRAHVEALGEAPVARLLALFVESTGATMDALGMATEAGRLEDVAALAHRLAGAADSVALVQCAGEAAALEETARRGEPVSSEAIQRLRHVHDASCATALRRLGELVGQDAA